MPDSPEATDLLAAADWLERQLRPVVGRDWTVRAGPVEWTVRETVAHLVDVCGFYAVHLAGLSQVRLPVDMRPHPAATDSQCLDLVAAASRLLANTIATADSAATAWHFSGLTDPAGFTSLACNELLIHGWDIARGLGTAWSVDEHVCAMVLKRSFPDAVADARVWPALLAANGRSMI